MIYPRIRTTSAILKVKKNVFILILAVYASVFFIACNKDDQSNDMLVEEKITDISYGTDDRQRYDAYLPANRSASTPLVVMIHGGAWTENNKEDITIVQQQFLAQGIAAININHRYASPTNHFEGLMEDVRLVLADLRSKSGNWLIRNNHIVLMGISSGAHMSLLYTYNFQQENEVDAVISLAGPTNFTEEQFLSAPSIPFLKPAIEAMVGATFNLVNPFPLNPRFAQASPSEHIAAVPTLMIHGDADRTVPFGQSVFLKAKLDEQNITNKLVTLSGVDHDLGFNQPAIATQVLSECIIWINTYSE